MGWPCPGPNGYGAKQLWKESTRANSLFLSSAVNLNSEILKPVYDWFVNDLVVYSANSHLTMDATLNLHEVEGQKQNIIKMLNAADPSISDIIVKKIAGTQHVIDFDLLEKKSVSRTEEKSFRMPWFTHLGNNGQNIFDFHQESIGTQRFFALLGPLINALRFGKIFVFDEIENSLHHNLVSHIISMFHDSGTNIKGAQLIFSTHNTSLLDQGLFRRDQIWLVEKDTNHATCLYPLSDYSPRKGEAVGKGYREGRFGAIPILSKHNLNG